MMAGSFKGVGFRVFGTHAVETRDTSASAVLTTRWVDDELVQKSGRRRAVSIERRARSQAPPPRRLMPNVSVSNRARQGSVHAAIVALCLGGDRRCGLEP